MAVSVRPGLQLAFYGCNFGVIICLLSAAFLLSQGLFGDLYSCNQKATGEIQFLYDTTIWGTDDYCMVDLNYTANEDSRNKQSFYALRVTLPCGRLYHPDGDANVTKTTLCYNHFHPEYFASATDADIVNAQSSHDEAVQYLDLGFRAALWMAFFGFMSSAINRHMDFLDKSAILAQEKSSALLVHLRARAAKWRERRQNLSTEEPTREAELHTISVEDAQSREGQSQ